ncbi:hypothetical protein H6G89_08070 [Oscillatoria sp. FACHB-1407]|uniref:hypothetical protein n=1 Tax=Oscillatoria sp. FACHB-1407 TaxID=2692847 RepID=UPI001689E47B|nr:hypothetical protein [Oscillatoria sp. FACHB-1407]MBD2460998.1 hypothetical protein [Oscillatoria sp. FACHB-1407]
MDRDQRLQPPSAEGEALNDEARIGQASPLPSTTVDDPWSEYSTPDTVNVLAWFRLLWEHPLVFWSGIWVLLLLITGIAVTSLMSPELSRVNPDSPDSPQPNVSTDVSSRTLPAWALGTITLSCIAGSLLISQRFKQVRRESRSPQSNTAAESLPLAEQSSDLALPLPLPAASPTMAALPAMTVVTPIYEPPEPEQPVVTVVPADESTPLDWEDAGLAEIMDIRYRRHR